jgi:hypothetical protein
MHTHAAQLWVPAQSTCSVMPSVCAITLRDVPGSLTTAARSATLKGIGAAIVRVAVQHISKRLTRIFA